MDPHFEMSPIDNTLIAVWIGDPSKVRLERLVGKLRELHGQHPKGVYLFNVITGTTGMPDQETRQTIARQFDSMRGRLMAYSKGLPGSKLSRTVISTLLTISRRPFALKIFARRDGAATWLSEHCGVDAPALTNLVQQIESRLSARVAAPASATDRQFSQRLGRG